MNESEARALVRDVIEVVADEMEAQGFIIKDRSFYMIDALRWMSYQQWQDDMPPVIVAKHAILSVAAGLKRHEGEVPPLYAKGAMSRAKEVCETLLRERFALELPKA